MEARNSPMKKGRSDLDRECNFKPLLPGLSSKEIKTLCLYEYMRESQALRDLHDQDDASNRPVVRVRPAFADKFGWDATLRLVLALRNAGFPNPWKALSKSARDQLSQAFTGWDDERKKNYPPVVIEPALERDLEREQEQGARFPIWRIRSFEPELRRCQRSRRKYFYGLIRIDEAYNETEAVKAFRNEFRKRWPTTRGGGGTDWRARLNQLAVMRIRKHERDPWKRLKLVTEFCHYKGCRDEVTAYKERCKQGRGDEQMGKTTQVEMSNARAEARAFFQSLFEGEEPLSYRASG